MQCPVTPRALRAFELAAQGLSNAEIAVQMGTTAPAVKALHSWGYRQLGVNNLTDALHRLTDDGWICGHDRLPPAAFRYLKAFDAYMAAPVHERDQMLVRDLCNDALEELLNGP